MKTSDFFYELPEELIAQTPLQKRDESRMLVFNRKSGEIIDKHFYNIVDYLTENDVLVWNRSRVIPARVYGRREGKEEIVEILLLKKLDLTTYECLVKPGKKFKVGNRIEFSGNLVGEVVSIQETGERIIKFEVGSGEPIEVELERIGEMPLPPYIKEKLNEKERYQTIYSKEEGSSAAPTAGLHFTQEIIEKLKNKGVQIEEVVLHVGLGTFRPVQVDSVENHVMHTEECMIEEETAKRLNEAKKNGKRIVAIGTTTVRTLESMIDEDGNVVAGQKNTNIFIYPPYTFKFVDALLTNFHLPESTLLMLVSALMGKENMEKCYKHAVDEKYRFFSFGDCMLII